MANLQSANITGTGNLTLPAGTIVERPTINKTVVSFTSTPGGGVWTVPANVYQVEVLVVGGGGGGGSEHGGGGGAGGVVYQSNYPTTPGQTITVTVGGGGAGGTYTSTNGAGGNGANGSNSVFGTIIAYGGGGGKAYRGGTTFNTAQGAAGGSGGGGGASEPGAIIGGVPRRGLVNAGGEGTLGQGNNGGYGGYPWDRGTYTGGGGGGAGGAGGDAGPTATSSFGGPGLSYDISGTLAFYGGGGGSSYYGSATAAPGGVGGGGNSGSSSSYAGVNGTANTGGGGGGSYDNAGAAAVGGAGGSGVVIVRYSLTAASTNPAGQTRVNTVTSALEVYGNKSNWNVQSVPESIVTNGLVLHLDAARYTSGDTWYDLTSNGNNVTLTNSPSYSTANGGNVVFDGVNEYGTISTFNKKPTTFMTCEAWVKPTKASVGTGTIRGGVISASNSMYLGIIDSRDGGNTFSLHFANQTSSSRTSPFVGQIPNNQWVHIVGTYDGVTARQYINGVEVWYQAQTGTITDGTYYIGTYGGGNVTDGVHNFKGGIAIARIYNRALTDAEVKQNYNAGSIRFGHTPKIIGRGAGLIGSSPANAAPSAKYIKEVTGTTENGFYWIRPGNMEPIYVWCDMNYDGGGWVLVMANTRAGAFSGSPTTNGMGGLSYYQCINNNNIAGTYTSKLEFKQIVGLKYWPALGLNVCQIASASSPTLSNTAAHTKRYRWSYTGFGSTYGFIGYAAVGDDGSGAGAPGMGAYHASAGWGFTTYDADNDTYSSNCANSYGNNPWWYGSCWSGNMWGGGNSGSYGDQPHWDGSGSDTHAYMAVYLKV